METNEIMTNEEVIETTEEIVKTGSGKNLKMAAGFGLAVVAGVIAYKYVAKPAIAKIKAKKKADKINLEEYAEMAVAFDEEEKESENTTK